MTAWTRNVLLIVAVVILVLSAIGYYNADYIYSTMFPEETDTPPAATVVEEITEEEVPPALPQRHSCTVSGTTLEGNQQWFQGQNTLVAISADASTFDESLGESHRIFSAFNTEDCSEKFKTVLPINFSADYPYYLTTIDSTQGELVGIMGVDKFFVYDVINNKLSPELKPTFAKNRQMEDAQSGNILGIATYGRYVLGVSEDQGVFAYDLTIPTNPKQEKPYAEYKATDNDFSSMYMLEDKEKSAPVVPKYDPNTGKFDLNPIFEKPQAVSQLRTKSAANDRYIILHLNDNAKTPVAVDLQTGKRIALAKELISKSDAEIMQALKKMKTNQ